MKKITLGVFVFLTVFVTQQVFAFSIEGQRTIKLIEEDSTSHMVGNITFRDTAGGTSYEITWDTDVFTDHFLSMRPFKCLEGDNKYWCRVPYPYENKRMITVGDLTDLEYDLLFVWKGAQEYGINLWNGIYYKLKIDNERLVGSLHEMDMDKLGVPPEAGDLRPVKDVDLEMGDPQSHWLPTLIIE